VGDFSFGEWVRQRRSALWLNLEELAQQVGCTVATLRRSETNEHRPSLALAKRLADRLELAGDQRAIFLQVARGLLSADCLPPPMLHRAMLAASTSPTSTPSLPSGTITFLFTDIEGSTKMWESDSDTAHQVLIRHDELIEGLVAQHQGFIVRSRGEGDGRFAVFARATSAVAAAVEIQRAFFIESWLTPEPLLI
jgi:transcriptional regulator with XRE-family HTH domain